MSSRLFDVILRGTAAARPLPADVGPGTLYWSTDTKVLERNNNTMTAWESYSVSGTGIGDVVGPAVAVDNHLAVFSGVTGKLIKDGGVIPTTPAYNGAQVTKSADLAAANYSVIAVVTWNSEIYDTNAYHDNVTNNSRLTVPAGVTKVNLCASMYVSDVVTTDWARVWIYRNGVQQWPGGSSNFCIASGSAVRFVSCTSLGVPVTAGDFFEVFFQVNTDTSVIIESDSTFTIQKVE